MQLSRRLSIAITFLLTLFLSACVKDVPLNSAKANQIDKTKLYVCKTQKNLNLAKRGPVIPVILDPITFTAVVVADGIYNGVAANREQSTFKLLEKDLDGYNLEQRLAESFANQDNTNKYFNFSSIEVIEVKNDKELAKILYAEKNRYVAFLSPKYIMTNNMNHIIIDAKLSVFDKSTASNASKLPKPIYQTSAKYNYKLPKEGWFSHVNNAKRLHENGGKLLIDSLNSGVASLSKDLQTKAENPL